MPVCGTEVLCNQFFVAIYKLFEKPYAGDKQVKDGNTNDSADNPCQHIQHIMVTGIYRCEPDTEHHHHKKYIHKSEFIFQAIVQYNYRVGRVERWHGRKNIGAFSIKRFEYANME